MKKIKSGIKIIAVVGVTIVAILVVRENIATQKASKEYNVLCKAKVFSDGPTGEAGTMSNEIKAYTKLYKKNNAKEVFKKLEKEATIEGKLYALCAFYYLDNKYYYSVINKYNLSNKTVNVQGGCILEKIKLSELVKKDNKDVVRLLNNKDTINKWTRRNKKESFQVDFIGGGIPCDLKDNIEFLKDHKNYK